MQRIIGIDVARALAVIGMVIVNFKMVIGGTGNSYIQFITGLLEGKAAATFVVLAGVGLAFMTRKKDEQTLRVQQRKAKRQLLKRAVFLFVLGLAYMPIWPADILHFYGIYMLVASYFLFRSRLIILIGALSIILIYPILMWIWEYDHNWDFVKYTYTNFWSLQGFVMNLLYNGFHPVFPWSAFMLLGLWFGKQNLHNINVVKKAMKISAIVFITTLLTSKGLLLFLGEGDSVVVEELTSVLGTSPMPPLPIYMISGASFAIFIISVCIYLAYKNPKNSIIKSLKSTGQLALTFYVAHVLLGMGGIEMFIGDELGEQSITFSFVYALLFSSLCIVFAVFWKRYYTHGPLEWIMRKLTN